MSRTTVAPSVTRREIFAQPELWADTVARMEARSSKLLPTDIAPPRIATTGAGTSAYAAEAVARAIGGRALPSTDLLTDRTLLEETDLLISLARSGDSPESVAVIEMAQRWKPSLRHLAITCNKAGRLANFPGVDAVVLNDKTNDQSLVMTSAFTNLVLAGDCLRHSAELRTHLDAIQTRVSTRHLDDLARLAEQVAANGGERVVYLASAPLFPLAKEAALKVLEMTAGRVIPIAETFLGLRHGPMSFLTKDTLIVGFLSTDPARLAYELDLIREVRAKGFERTVLVADAAQTDALDHKQVHTVPLSAPELPDVLRTPFEAPFAQLLGLAFSLRCGLDPDRPSPGDVITRVVSQFRIHASNGQA